MWATNGLRPPVFHGLLSPHAVPPTLRRSSRLPFQTLHLFRGLRLSLRVSALPCPVRVNLTTRQDSLEGTDGWVAPPARRETPLQHPWSPRSTGGLRRGALALTTTGRAPVSRQSLSRHTSAWLGARSAKEPRSGNAPLRACLTTSWGTPPPGVTQPFLACDVPPGLVGDLTSQRHDVSPCQGRCPTPLRVSLVRTPGWVAPGELSSAPCSRLRFAGRGLCRSTARPRNTFASPSGCSCP